MDPDFLIAAHLLLETGVETPGYDPVALRIAMQDFLEADPWMDAELTEEERALCEAVEAPL